MTNYFKPQPYIEVNDISLPKLVRIYDRTLRGIVQTTGKKYAKNLRALFAKELAGLGVDIIEVGIPFLSEEEKEDIKKVTSLDLNVTLSALARTCKGDVLLAKEVGVDRVHTFIATSKFHMENLIFLNSEEVIRNAAGTIEYVKELGLECEFTIRDAMNTDLDFLFKFVEQIQKAGVDVVNIPDTIGITTPRTVYNFIKKIKEKLSVELSVHFHDDFGLATANALAAVEAGANQIHAAVLGWSERAGMPATEEITIALRELYDIQTNVDLRKLYGVAEHLSKEYNIPIHPNKAVVGANAFLYEVGPYIHSNGSKIIQYEPYSPMLVGRERNETQKGF